MATGQVRITWNTDYIGSSCVSYGTTSSYGSTVTSAGGTAHTVDLMNLSPGTAYRFMVHSQSSSTPGDTSSSYDLGFTTPSDDDAGRKVDAGNSVANGLLIVPLEFTGALSSVNDGNDFYSIYIHSGQQVEVFMAVPSGFDYDLYVLDPQGVIKASRCTRSLGGTESINYVADTDGRWSINVRHYSGVGRAVYSLKVDVSSSVWMTYPGADPSVRLIRYNASRALVPGWMVIRWHAGRDGGFHAPPQSMRRHLSDVNRYLLTFSYYSTSV